MRLPLIEYLITKNELRYEKLIDNEYYMNIYSCYAMEKKIIRSCNVNRNGYVLFQGQEFPAVRDTDEYLTHFYDDYMQLPPKRKQRPHHIEIY